MATLNTAARALVESGPLAHMATLNEDGSPQGSVVWVSLDGDELMSAHLDGRQRKLRNLRRDPQVTLSFEADTGNDVGMWHYLVLHGRATVTKAAVRSCSTGWRRPTFAPGAVSPPMPAPPPGFVTHISVSRVGGSGPWADD